jgi:hypothetical protein
VRCSSCPPSPTSTGASALANLLVDRSWDVTPRCDRKVVTPYRAQPQAARRPRARVAFAPASWRSRAKSASSRRTKSFFRDPALEAEASSRRPPQYRGGRRRRRERNSWERCLSEAEICEAIISERPSYKVLTGRLPSDIGLTPAIMAAAIEAECLTRPGPDHHDADDRGARPARRSQDVHERWKAATDRAENQRAENIAKNVRSKVGQRGARSRRSTKLPPKPPRSSTRDLRVYVMVDKSGSMENALAQAKDYLSKFVGMFPLERLHVCVFNTIGREVQDRVCHARQRRAGLSRPSVRAAEPPTQRACAAWSKNTRQGPDEDALFIFVGDQGDNSVDYLVDTIKRHERAACRLWVAARQKRLE